MKVRIMIYLGYTLRDRLIEYAARADAAACPDPNARGWAKQVEMQMCEEKVRFPVRPPRCVILAQMSVCEVAALADELRQRYSCVGVLGWGGAVDAGELFVDVTSCEPHVVLIEMRNSEDYFKLWIVPTLNTHYNGYKQMLAIARETK